jgi:hypothetical protein
MSKDYMNVRVSPNLKQAVVARAKSDGASMTAVVIAALEAYLGIAPLRDHADPDEPARPTGWRFGIRRRFGGGDND